MRVGVMGCGVISRAYVENAGAFDSFAHPAQSVAAAQSSEGLAGRDSVVDRQRRAVGFVAQGDGGACAGRVARDVRERFLCGAVEREAPIGWQCPRFAFDAERHVEVHIGFVAVDQRRKLGERR